MNTAIIDYTLRNAALAHLTKELHKRGPTGNGEML